jgi:hypothetical protein
MALDLFKLLGTIEVDNSKVEEVKVPEKKSKNSMRRTRFSL